MEGCALEGLGVWELGSVSIQQVYPTPIDDGFNPVDPTPKLPPFNPVDPTPIDDDTGVVPIDPKLKPNPIGSVSPIDPQPKDNDGEGPTGDPPEEPNFDNGYGSNNFNVEAGTGNSLGSSSNTAIEPSENEESSTNGILPLQTPPESLTGPTGFSIVNIPAYIRTNPIQSTVSAIILIAIIGGMYYSLYKKK